MGEQRAAPTYSRHGPGRDVGLLDALAPPVGREDGFLLRDAAVGIGTGHLTQGVPDDAVGPKAHGGQQVYDDGGDDGGDVGDGGDVVRMVVW